MGELTSAFEYGIPAAIIMAIYLIAIKIIDARKEKKQAKINSDLIDSFSKLNKFLEYFTKDIIEKEQDKCSFAIKNSFNSFTDALIKFSINTIINNNVAENKSNIADNIERIVSTEYWNVYSNLMLFRSNDCNVSDYMETKWKDELIEAMKSIIFDDVKDKDKRIYNINNKLHITIDSYCIHVINRHAKHN